MTAILAPAARFPPNMLGSLLRSHPSERKRDILFQEEARAERFSNLIRIAYLFAWMTVSVLLVPSNEPGFNRINLGGGGIWLAFAIGLQTFLALRPYRPALKYLSTGLDMTVMTSLLAAYALAAGPAFALKMPIHLNYFCCLGLVALRFHRALAVYAAVVSITAYLSAWLAFDLFFGIDYGDSFDHAGTARVHAKYLAFNAIYLAVFGLLVYTAAVNVRRLLDLRAAEARRALRARERAVLAAGVAHEIRNPLAGIHGAAQLLREEGKGSARYTGMILDDAERLNGVVEGFLRFSRPFPLRPRDTDLAALAREFCRTETELFPESPLECGSGNGSLRVRTDREAVRQILLNLARNARRYQPPGRPVRVRAEGRGGFARIHVEDDGPGVPPDRIDALFEPFRTSSPEGAGVGLALSRKIARELGGDLTHEPLRPGARFTVTVHDYPGDAA